jgi:hypothetical protein
MLQVPMMPISHLVNRFNGYDASTELALLDVLSQLTLGLTRAEQWTGSPPRFAIPLLLRQE